MRKGGRKYHKAQGSCSGCSQDLVYSLVPISGRKRSGTLLQTPPHNYRTQLLLCPITHPAVPNLDLLLGPCQILFSSLLPSFPWQLSA